MTEQLIPGPKQEVCLIDTFCRRFVDVSERVLSFSQRQALASLVRTRAARL